MIAISIAWFLLGLLLLALGGDSIVKAVAGLAQRFGASAFTAGLLLLGVATSLPELAVNARALVLGQPELALGNAIGSSIANLGLTLAVAATAAPLLLRARLQGVLWWSLLAAGLLLIVFGLDGRLQRWEAGAALGWPPLLVGLLPVAIGTTLPEVAAAIAAARRGHGDMVLGHVLGSSVVNLLLVIGAMGLLQPLALPASFVRLELPALLAFALVLYPMLRGDLKISRGEGAILLGAFVAWLGLEIAMVM